MQITVARMEMMMKEEMVEHVERGGSVDFYVGKGIFFQLIRQDENSSGETGPKLGNCLKKIDFRPWEIISYHFDRFR